MIDLRAARPVWRAPEALHDAVRGAFGKGWEVVIVEAETSSDGDGGSSAAEVVRAAAGAEVYMGWGVPRAVVDAAGETLRWAHTASAGAGGAIRALKGTRVVLTNSRGVHAEPMADWTVAAIGFCLRGFHRAVAAQREGRWAKDEFTDGSIAVREFAGSRVGIVGLGGIGRAVARRCALLGMEVRGVRRHADKPKPRGVRWVGGPGDLAKLAEQSNVFVIAVPHTGNADRMVDGVVLDALPAGAFVLNVARGALLDEGALLERLNSGQIAGAVLDVFGEEPLPAGHPFWTHPGVLVFPHVSAVSDRFWERETELIMDNVSRYLRGRRLKNLVDFSLGY